MFLYSYIYIELNILILPLLIPIYTIIIIQLIECHHSSMNHVGTINNTNITFY